MRDRLMAQRRQRVAEGGDGFFGVEFGGFFLAITQREIIGCAGHR